MHAQNTTIYKLGLGSSLLTMATYLTHSCDLNAVPFMVTLRDSGGAQIAGENYTLTCRGGTFSYGWRRNGTLLTSQISDTLSFSPLRETDSGFYACEGTRSSMTVISTSVTVTVVGKRLIVLMKCNG